MTSKMILVKQHILMAIIQYCADMKRDMPELAPIDFLDTNFKKQHGKYIGWTAQIIQHEVDHCNGIVI